MSTDERLVITRLQLNPGEPTYAASGLPVRKETTHVGTGRALPEKIGMHLVDVSRGRKQRRL